MLCVFIALTISIEKVGIARAENRKDSAASVAALFFMYAYNACYNIGNNALTYSKTFDCSLGCCTTANHGGAYLVELFPYAERARGIAIEQFFGRIANFFSTYVSWPRSTYQGRT